MSARSAPESPEADDGPSWGTYVLDLVSSAAAVAAVGLLLFAVSGVWPPLVAIESPSMSPHIKTGDLVFVMDEQRFPGPGDRDGTGVVTARAGEGTDYSQFQGPGDVIVYEPDGDGSETPIIHRAMFWVDEGERWVEDANDRYVGPDASCEDVASCPAPNAGFVTKGDNNGQYDQVAGIRSCDDECNPVKPSWIVGTAQVRIPALGHVRLRTGGVAATPADGSGDAPDPPAAVAPENTSATPA